MPDKVGGVADGSVGKVHIAAGRKFSFVLPADRGNLPQPGPYPTGKESMIALAALRDAKVAIEQAEAVLQACRYYLVAAEECGQANAFWNV
jgi:hypothetical protein